jgi:hypothetical protein
MGYRLPPPEALSASASSASAAGSETSLTVSQCMKSPQFSLMWVGFGASIAGSYGILAAGQTMLTEVFGATLPSAAFATSFVAAMSGSNLAGRLLWANASDAMAKKSADPFWGRRNAFSLIWGVGAPLYGAVLWSIHVKKIFFYFFFILLVNPQFLGQCVYSGSDSSCCI